MRLVNYTPLVFSKREDVPDEAYYGCAFLYSPFNLLRKVGDDCGASFFMRSLSKPIQASLMQDFDVASRFNFSDKEIAITCASHSGTNQHIALVRSILNKADLDESYLKCPAAKPLDERDFDGKIKSVYHNCSAKHALMLVISKLNGWDLSNYTDVSHPIQKLIYKRHLELSGASFAKISFDGCSTPVFALKIDDIAKAFENSWKTPGELIDVTKIPTLDDFLHTVEDLCEELDISRIVLFIDEAAHVFLPQQQREFFTLFRDLRSPYIKCNAAVYPGVTVYGETFEPVHDAVTVSLVRNVNDQNYVSIMKQMVLKQIHDSSLAANLSRHGENFTLLAYAASGNPRYLLTSVSMAEKMDSKSVNQVFRDYYREKLWAEHTKLSERYPGYKDFIAWGRDFLETTVLPELKKKNDEFIEHDNGKGTTAYFWIHNNAPHEVKEALRILEYSGLIYEDSAGIRATRSEIGTRYMVNIGCLLAIEATPATSGMKIIKESDIRRMSEYGANYPAYQGIQGKIVGSETDALKEQLEKSIDLLELTDWQKQKMHEISIDTIGDLISAPEEKLKQAKYIADVRARTIKNAGIAAVCEYLLG